MLFRTKPADKESGANSAEGVIRNSSVDILENKFKWLKPRAARKQLFLNYKGGTGKTSLSAAYGACLARGGKKVLMVDLDAQAHLTACFNQEGLLIEKSLYDVIVEREYLCELIVKTSTPRLELIPSAISLSSLEVPLFNMSLREFQLRILLKKLEKEYDFIIIDSAPNIGLLSLNAILASDEIIVPVLADFLSFHGLKLLLETLASIEKDFSFYLAKVRILLNRYNPAYGICKECKEAVEKFYPDYLLETVIHESQEIINASSLGKSVFETHPNSRIVTDIKNLAQEINGL